MSVSESSSDWDSDGPPPLQSPSYDVEFRSTGDDAWYNVRVVLEDDKLRVKYQNFGDEENEVFESKCFKTLDEVKLFEDRFRPLSSQLQDSQCGKVVQGTLVCASNAVFSSSDVRFYDAVVDDVIYQEHSFANAEEECLCTFVVIWRHGPHVGCLANKKIEHICLVQSSGLLDPALSRFLDDVRNWVKSNAGVCNSDGARDKGNARSTRSTASRGGSQGIVNQVTRKDKQKSSTTWESEERLSNFSERCKEDVDIGGDEGHQVLLIDNMDKELSPSTITDFIYGQTSVPVEAYVFPSLSSETYTQGVILLDSKWNLQKLAAFLDSPNHIVLSCRGSACRPWVLCDTLCGHNAFIVPSCSALIKYQDKLHHSSREQNVLKVVCIGSEEYTTAKKLKELFIEFARNQRQLHKRLALEEKIILQASNEV